MLTICGLTDYSRLKTARLKPVPNRISIRHLAIGVLRNMELQALQQETELILDVHPGLPTTVRCDRVMLQRVLTNLVANALNFCTGGQVLVQASWDAIARGRLRVSVSDTGKGMTTAELEHLFQQFFQGAHGKGGTGLGLSICQQLVSEMGGTIKAFSPGKGLGSTFNFDISARVAKNYTGWVCIHFPVAHVVLVLSVRVRVGCC